MGLAGIDDGFELGIREQPALDEVRRQMRPIGRNRRRDRRHRAGFHQGRGMRLLVGQGDARRDMQVAGRPQRQYEARVALFAQQAMAGRPVIAGPVALSVTALFPIPASWPKKRQAAARAGTEQHTKRPDLDNILKAIKDGLNGVAWKDDSQVCVLRECRKGYSDTSRVLVTVEEIACVTP